MEHILATKNESRLGDKVSTFALHFQDCIFWPLESIFVLNNNIIIINFWFYCRYDNISGSGSCCIQSDCFQNK